MLPKKMQAVLLTGFGGLERLKYHKDVPVPNPDPGQVLVNIIAAGMNNTDINTRTGGYNASVETGTTAAGGEQDFGVDQGGIGDWSGNIVFSLLGRIGRDSLLQLH
ncbi:MAG: hypothetical protein GY896_12340 [Gammaproteobacteria bacterium]|nr:hypothetical protein [Gammaproteobacteria bacterium]